MGISPEFFFNFEANMQWKQGEAYAAYHEEMIWQRLATEMPSTSREERVAWFLESAKIERSLSKSGNSTRFRDMIAQHTVYENESADDGLTIAKTELEDTDGKGLRAGAEWSEQAGRQAAYWPQRAIVDVLLTPGTGYDGVAFFGTTHPVNPFDSSMGTYANDFTGAASGSYPGALPIGGATTVDVALANIGKLAAYIAGIKCANGRELRKLRIGTILVPPALYQRAIQLTNAEFVAQAAASGGGSGDVKALVKSFQIAEVVQVDELAASVGGDESTWYVVAKMPGSQELGPFVYINREPFNIGFYGPQDSNTLNRIKMFEWTISGRNTAGTGHPYLIFRCKAT